MPSTALFHWARIRTNARNAQVLAANLNETTLPALAIDGGKPWIIANGLFGLWTNELILVTTWPEGTNARGALAAKLPPQAEITEQYDLVATARPSDETPPSRPGLYVHRLFEVREQDIERFVSLSEEAWTTFETASDYAAEPQGLFRQREHPSEGGLMLLVTWYDRLESWERSRTPAPAATANFRERAMLTRKSLAIATRLAGETRAAPGMGPG